MAAPSGKMEANLPRLNDDNFEAWTMSLQMICLALGIENYAFPDAAGPIDPATLKAEELKNFYLLANAMMNSLDAKLKGIAMGGGRPNDMMPHLILDRLEKYFNPATRSNDLQLRRQLYTMRFNGKKSLDEFANEILLVANKINAIASKFREPPISERDLIAVLVLDLPIEYSAEVAFIERDRKIGFNEALESLRDWEQRSSVSSSSSGSSGSINSAQGDKKRVLFCEECGKQGHTTDKCYKIHGYPRDGRGGRGSRSRGRGQRGRGGRGNGRAGEASNKLIIMMTDDEIERDETSEDAIGKGDEIAVHEVGRDGEVILDSGCSRHVCGKSFLGKLQNWRTGPPVRVRVADGSRHTSDQYASLTLSIKTDDGPREIFISEVLYIEEITNLLLSIGSMTRKGINFTFSQDTLKIAMPTGSITVRKSPPENLYKLHIFDAESDPKGLNIARENINGIETVPEKILIWHNALGHPGRSAMIRLSDGEKIPKFRPRDIQRALKGCTACNISKTRAHTTPKRSENPATNPLQ